jgi:hypothetical protein
MVNMWLGQEKREMYENTGERYQLGDRVVIWVDNIKMDVLETQYIGVL